MTLTITLPESVAKRAASANWTPQELAEFAVESIAVHLREMENMTEMFDENGESVGFHGPVIDEFPPLDAATIAEIKDDIANERHYSTEEMMARSDAALEAWRISRVAK